MTARSGAAGGSDVLVLRPGGERLEVWEGTVTLDSFRVRERSIVWVWGGIEGNICFSCVWIRPLIIIVIIIARPFNLMQDLCEAHRILYRVLVGWLRQQASRRKVGKHACTYKCYGMYSFSSQQTTRARTHRVPVCTRSFTPVRHKAQTSNNKSL